MKSLQVKSLWNRLGKSLFICFVIVALFGTTISQVNAYDGDYKPYQQGQSSEDVQESGTTETSNQQQFSGMAMNAGLTSTSSMLMSASARSTEVEIGRSNTAQWNGGYFYEYMTKEYLSENNTNDTVRYRIRYKLKHWGGYYTYQVAPVYLYVNNQHVDTYSAHMNIHYSNVDKTLGYTDITLKKGVNNVIEFRDPGNSSSMTTINVSGVVYHALPTYTVTFANGYGGTAKTQTVTKYQSATPPSISRNGYTFAGWSGTYTNVTSNRTITAKWTPNTYYVTYNANGGSGAPGSTAFKFDSGTKISSGIPTRTGYTFTGWNTAANGSGTAFSPGATIPNGWRSFTLYAQWNINRYTVSFNSNGGSTVASQSVTYGSKVSKPSNPTKAGYTFVGWYTNATLTTAYNFNSAVTGNMALYAKWNKNPVMSGVDIYYIEGYSISDSNLILGHQAFVKSGTSEYPNKLTKGYYPITATDAEDGNLISYVKVSSIKHSDGTSYSSIDCYKLGTYTITYTVTDKGGATSHFARKMTILPKSTASLNANDRYFYRGSTISNEILLSKVTASDNYDGNLSDTVWISYNNVNADVTGDYRVRYSVKNSSDRTTTKYVTIHVIDRIIDEAKSVSIRYIDDNYLDTLDDNSKWLTDTTLNTRLKQSLQKEATSQNAIKEYTFNKEDIKAVQEFSKEQEYSQAANQLFNSLFARCQVK